MPRRHIDLELLEIAKSTKERLESFKRGVYIQTVSGRSIDQLRVDACLARWRLAVRFRTYAGAAYKGHPKQSRLVISRSYYSMYHAARAVVFHHAQGDDHEAHSELANHLPGDFPDRNVWVNSFRNARLERNKADYDPYPRREAAFSSTAQAVYKDCNDFLLVCRPFLRKKGIPT